MKGKGKGKAERKEKGKGKGKEKEKKIGMDDSFEEVSKNVQIPSIFIEETKLSFEKIGDYWKEKVAIISENSKLDDSEKADIIGSMSSPFNSLENITWKVKSPVDLSLVQKINPRDEPYSIVSFYINSVCKKNIIYGAKGKCIAQVDFDDHGHGEPHIHILIPGQLDHDPKAEEHSFSWKVCPWFWLVVPMGCSVKTDDKLFNLIPVTLNFEDFSKNRIELLAYSFNKWILEDYKRYRTDVDSFKRLAFVICSLVVFCWYGDSILKGISRTFEELQKLEDDEESCDYYRSQIAVMKKIQAELEFIQNNPENSRAALFLKVLNSIEHIPPDPRLPSQKIVEKIAADATIDEGVMLNLDETIDEMVHESLEISMSMSPDPCDTKSPKRVVLTLLKNREPPMPLGESMGLNKERP